MSTIQRWFMRISAVLAGAGLALVVPALAWASATPATLAVADDLARKRPKVSTGGFGLLGGLCCVAVVVIVIVAVVLVAKKRRS